MSEHFRGIWVATNCDRADGLVRKLKALGTHATRHGRDVYIRRADGRKPWAELSGHMTAATQVEPRNESDPIVVARMDNVYSD